MVRYSSNMTEKDCGVSFADRWRLVPKGIENPSLGDIRKRWIVIAGTVAGLVCVASQLMHTDSPTPTKPSHPTVVTNENPFTAYEHCMQEARTEMRTNPAMGQIAAEQCRADFSPVIEQHPSSTAVS